MGMIMLDRQQGLLDRIHTRTISACRLAAISVSLRIVATRGWTSSGQLFAPALQIRRGPTRGSHAFKPYPPQPHHALKSGSHTLASVVLTAVSNTNDCSIGWREGGGRVFSYGALQTPMVPRKQQHGCFFLCNTSSSSSSSTSDTTKVFDERDGDGNKVTAAAATTTTTTTTKSDVSNSGCGSTKSSYGSGGGKLLRLSKLLADRAIGTRAEVDKLVIQGRVKVEGTVVKSPKKKVSVDSIIEVNGKLCKPIPLLVAYHKPKGVITTMSDDWDREDLSKVLPMSLLRRHHPVGRLDGDSSGLLLLSSEGLLTHRLLSPKFKVEREYAATVDVPELGIEPGEALIQTLSKGVVTADGTYEADVAAIEGREVNIVVREGKHRMVRRMLANAGYPVLELRRERYGKIRLGDLAEGDHKPVMGAELAWARSLLEEAQS